MILIEYIYASLLLHYAKKPLEEKNLRKVLEAAGIAVDEIRLKAIIAALKEINIDEAISAATSAMTVTAIPAAPVSPPTEGKGKVVEEDKKKEEKEEEEIAEGLAALFG